MNPQDNDKQDDSTSNGPDGQGDSVDERSERLGEESRSMNDEYEYEYAATSDAGTGGSEGRDEGPELTDLLRQATRLLRRQFVATAADGGLGDRGQALREHVHAVVDDALSDEERTALTDSMGKIVVALGTHAEDVDDEWNDRREFAGRRGSAARRKFARRFTGGFGPRGDWSPGRYRNPRHEWDQRDAWGSHDGRDEDIIDEGRPEPHRSHDDCGPGAYGAEHRGRGHLGHRGHRGGGARRRGMGRSVGASFERGYAAGYKHGARS